MFNDCISGQIQFIIKGAQGTTTIDFGAFPGSSDTLIVVTGQAGIVAGSLVEAWLRLVDSADHLADEHWLETISVFAGNIVAGTGFTIYARNNSELFEMLVPGGEGRAAVTTFGAQALDVFPRIGGIGTRIYGVWNVNWVWN